MDAQLILPDGTFAVDPAWNDPRADRQRWYSAFCRHIDRQELRTGVYPEVFFTRCNWCGKHLCDHDLPPLRYQNRHERWRTLVYRDAVCRKCGVRIGQLWETRWRQRLGILQAREIINEIIRRKDAERAAALRNCGCAMTCSPCGNYPVNFHSGTFADLAIEIADKITDAGLPSARQLAEDRLYDFNSKYSEGYKWTRNAR